jgi:hypothetical protein
MRTVLTTGGIPTFVSSQESKFLEQFEDRPVYKKSLNERDAEIARSLNSRGVLQRFKDHENGIYYTMNQNRGIK